MRSGAPHQSRLPFRAPMSRPRSQSKLDCHEAANLYAAEYYLRDGAAPIERADEVEALPSKWARLFLAHRGRT